MQNVTRHIKASVSCLLWGRAAGRCQFDNCNRPLYRSPTTQEDINIAERAHIYSFSEGGSRGHEDIPTEELNDLSNLMLICHDCHRTIDAKKDGGRYTPQLLQQWKGEHEFRVELVTGVQPGKHSHVLLYGANVGDHSGPLCDKQTSAALFPHHYPASPTPVQIGMLNSTWTDRDDSFWLIERENLVRQYQKQVTPHITSGQLKHISVFALAPQPLLIELGTLLTDIVPADVYPLLREPQGWAWSDEAEALEFLVHEPERTGGPPALVVGLSATVDSKRVTQVLGSTTAIWTVTLRSPHNDALRSRQHLRDFRRVMRPLLDKIKAKHGQETELNIFPAVSVAAATELGRVRMPKADMPWQVYDQVNARGGFVPALRIGSRLERGVEQCC